MSLLERKPMAEEQKTPESQKNMWDLLDVLTSRIGKITPLVGGITGLVVGVYEFIPKNQTRAGPSPLVYL